MSDSTGVFDNNNYWYNGNYTIDSLDTIRFDDSTATATTVGNITVDTTAWASSRVPSNEEIMDAIKELKKDLTEMRQVLLILSRDVKLEEKYDEIKEAYDNYVEVLANYEAWEILTKKTDAEEAEDDK